jgi:hypothetical protein
MIEQQQLADLVELTLSSLGKPRPKFQWPTEEVDFSVDDAPNGWLSACATWEVNPRWTMLRCQALVDQIKIASYEAAQSLADMICKALILAGGPETKQVVAKRNWFFRSTLDRNVQGKMVVYLDAKFRFDEKSVQPDAIVEKP